MASNKRKKTNNATKKQKGVMAMDDEQEKDSAKSVYLCLSLNPPMWHQIKPVVGLSMDLLPRPSVLKHLIDGQLEKQFPGFGCVACNSKLYAFGGNVGSGKMEGTTDILVCDPKVDRRCRSLVWTKIGELPQPRFAPALSLVGNKIYIFGTERSSVYHLQPWAMVYCTESQSLSPLKQPPKYLARAPQKCFTVLYNNQILLELLLKTGDKLIAYNLSHGDWSDVTAIYPDFPRLSEKNVVLDGVLFTFFFGKFIAYDFVNKRSIYPVPSLGDVFDKFVLSSAGEGFVLDLGEGRMSALWITPTAYHELHSFLDCITFDVSIHRSGGNHLEFYTTLLSTSTYHVDSPFIWSCAAIDDVVEDIRSGGLDQTKIASE